MRQVRTCDFCSDDAAGLYEPSPPSVPDGPRLLLCEGCRDRLSSVVDPLVAALEGDAEPDTGSQATPPSPDDGNEAPAREADERPRAGRRTAGAGEAGQTAGAGEAASDPTLPPDERSVEPATAETGQVNESRDAGGRSQGERAGAPTGYRKVMRLLENRELPMDRQEAVDLAAEAYELDGEEVSAAIDHAVRYGRFREVGGELKR